MNAQKGLLTELGEAINRCRASKQMEYDLAVEARLVAALREAEVVAVENLAD